MRFLAYDPFIPRTPAPIWASSSPSMERVLAESDFVHIYVPMKEDTFHIVGAEQLKQMKPTAYLVNSSARVDGDRRGGPARGPDDGDASPAPASTTWT